MEDAKAEACTRGRGNATTGGLIALLVAPSDHDASNSVVSKSGVDILFIFKTYSKTNACSPDLFDDLMYKQLTNRTQTDFATVCCADLVLSHTL